MVPIGRPIWNTQLCILDADLNAVPIGVVGELYIGGAGLARGYHGRPGLTAERFVPNPFGREPGERLYRTGDLARWRPDGSIDYVGRIDHQVKVRGFRIELGEIEARLLAHEDVGEAVVVARDGSSGKQLIGYVVCGAGGGMDEVAAGSLGDRLRDHLRSVLPDYMVPARIVVLDRMPLTPNGKLDRKALPEPDFAGADYVAPDSEIERKLVAIWEEVLGLDRIGITDNFFELGGDSILSLQIIARARKEGLKLTPKQLFEKQTIKELALECHEIHEIDEMAAMAAQILAHIS
jgi:aryl carrier-like protein